MATDIQEPPRTVAGCLQRLSQRYSGQLDERAGEFIRLAVDGATRMQTLINDLLTFSRVATRGNAFQPTNSREIVDHVLWNLDTAIRESGAQITVDPLPQVSVDPTQFAQLVQNLVSNAIKFRTESPPAIHVTAVQSRGEWTFSVRDNGIGIESRYVERVFEIFRRLHTQAEYPGTGIGFALATKIVERHGGRIWVEYSPGQGSTFFFTIPEGG